MSLAAPLPEEQLLSFPEALAGVLRLARDLTPVAATERLPLLEAHTRVLARDLHADRDQPPFDRSTRDGFAVHLSPDLSSPTGPWRVLGQIFAGESWPGAPLCPGEAVEIMTGAPVPPGAAAVVMVEHVTAVSKPPESISLTAGRSIAPGANIVPRAREAAAGDVVLPAGTRLNPAGIALCASSGAAAVDVVRRPRVAILSTGDELVELAINAPPLAPHQIRNSNSYALAALVAEAGGDPWRLPIARDTRESLHSILAEAVAADLILLTGGVSMGRHDLVEEVLLTLGARFHFTGVRMQPGRPVVFGTLPRSGAADLPLFGLPGNPVSTEVTFRCFVAPVLRALAGEHDPRPRFALAHLAEDVAGNPVLTRLLPAHLESEPAGSTVRLVPWQGSGDLAANARANSYAVLPPERTRLRAGDLISVLLR